jgi:hypothetical protein
MNSLENVKNQITNMMTNPTTMTYSCLGISTAILGYYTFFKSSDDEPGAFSEKAAEPEPEPQPEPEPEPEPEAPSEQTGGKKKKKKSTRRQKRHSRNKKNSSLRR